MRLLLVILNISMHSNVAVTNSVAHLSNQPKSERKLCRENRIKHLAFEITIFRPNVRIYQDSCFTANYFTI